MTSVEYIIGISNDGNRSYYMREPDGRDRNYSELGIISVLEYMWGR